MIESVDEVFSADSIVLLPVSLSKNSFRLGRSDVSLSSPLLSSVLLSSGLLLSSWLLSSGSLDCSGFSTFERSTSVSYLYSERFAVTTSSYSFSYVSYP